ncbi:MAG: hypothetical protein V7640_805 [Betaproteobacteria bacterium]
MEILLEVLLAVVQLVAELVLQIILEALAELGVRSVIEPFRRPKPLHPVLALIGYAILGAIAGTISLWLFPTLFIETGWLRVLSLVVTPLLAGAAMAALGAWRRRRDQELIRLDRFTYGFTFALAMALVRFTWGR